MLTISPDITDEPFAKKVWYSDNQNFKCVLANDNHLYIYRKTGQVYLQKCNIPIFPKRVAHNFCFNDNKNLVAWLSADNLEITLIDFKKSTCRSLPFQFLIDTFQLSNCGEFIVAESKYETNIGYFTADHQLVGCHQPKLYCYNITTSELTTVPNVSAYCLIGDKLYISQRDYSYRYRFYIYKTLSALVQNNKQEILTEIKIYLKPSYICVDRKHQKMAITSSDIMSRYRIDVYDLQNSNNKMYLEDVQSKIVKLSFNSNGARLYCLSRFIPSFPPGASTETLHIFLLNDLRQSYQLPLNKTGHESVKMLNNTLIVTTCDHQTYTWQLPNRNKLSDRLSFQFILKNNKKVSINGITLLQLAHQVVKKILNQKILSNPKQADTLHVITSGHDWLHLIGRLAQFIGGADINIRKGKLFPRVFSIGPEQHQIHIKKRGEDAYVQFPGMGGSYQAIALFIQAMANKNERSLTLDEIIKILSFPLQGHNVDDIIKSSINYQHATIATLLLNRIKLAPYPETFSEKEKKFFDSLLLLMLGVESSRVNTTYLTTILLLDLIAHHSTFGRSHRAYNWNNAFTSGPGYQWDDFENYDYGGKFPMAVRSTGAGNFRFRATMLQYHDEAVALEQIIADPQTHQIPKKEISILIHWLHALDEPHKTNLATSKTLHELKTKISILLADRFEAAYELTENAQPTLIKNTLGFANKAQLADKEQDITGIHYYLKINNITRLVSKDGENYHRTDIGCKLVNPKFICSEEKIITTSSGNNTVTAIPVLVERKWIGIRKIVCQSSFENHRSSSGLYVNNGIVIVPSPSGETSMSKEESELIIKLVKKFTDQYILPYFDSTNELLKNIQFTDLIQDESEKQVYTSISLETIEELIAAIAPSLRHRLSATEILQSMWRKLNSMEGIQFGKPKLMTHVFQTSLALGSQMTDAQYIPKSSEEYSKKLTQLASKISPDFTVKMKNLAYHFCDSMALHYQKIYSTKTRQNKILTECSYCYSAKTPPYPGPPYAYRNSLCYYYPNNTHFHRVLSHNLCDNSHYDTETHDIYTQHLEQRLTATVTFVATAKKRAFTPCPKCWW